MVLQISSKSAKNPFQTLSRKDPVEKGLCHILKIFPKKDSLSS